MVSRTLTNNNIDTDFRNRHSVIILQEKKNDRKYTADGAPQAQEKISETTKKNSEKIYFEKISKKVPNLKPKNTRTSASLLPCFFFAKQKKNKKKLAK
jgi:hypothetical protein